MLLRLLPWRTGCGRVNGSDFGWKGDLFFGKSYEILEKSAFRWRKNIKIMDCIRQRNTLSKTEIPENIGDRSLLQSIIWKLAWPIWACPITSSDTDVNSQWGFYARFYQLFKKKMYLCSWSQKCIKYWYLTRRIFEIVIYSELQEEWRMSL